MMRTGGHIAGRRGGPLVLLSIVLLSWLIGRSAMWESPFVPPSLALSQIEFAPPADADDLAQLLASKNLEKARRKAAGSSALLPTFSRYGSQLFATSSMISPRTRPQRNRSTKVAVGHQRLMQRAFGVDWYTAGIERALGRGPVAYRGQGQSLSNAPPPFSPFAPANPQGQEAGKPDRWTLDTFGYFRQGSGSLSTSQGRVPVYGASQAAAKLEYRFAPDWGFDPRGFVRAYRALVDGGETEVAAGLSARPVPQVPLRLYGEMRVSRNPVGTDYRPAVYVVSELPPQRLPADFSLETYAAAGYVGGDADTYFADGQATLMREMLTVTAPGGSPVRVSLGGGGWGGAQRGAERVDVGPTMRFDLNVGEVPARISVDWRERVLGEAAPESGVAATISTQF